VLNEIGAEDSALVEDVLEAEEQCEAPADIETMPKDAKKVKKSRQSQKLKPESGKQMTLGFDTATTGAQQSHRTEKKHGAKKSKK
jgi:hypothetical protein